MSRRGPLLGLILTLVIPCVSRPDGRAREAAAAGLLVAAAADLQFALPEIVTLWEARHPEVAVRVTYGSSGTLFAQISNGAPFDIFLSANLKYAQALVLNGRGMPGTLFTYALGRLALWIPNRAGIDPGEKGIRTLLLPSLRRIAVANPEHAPYGAAAIEALGRAGILGQVEGRLVRGESAAQAAQFVESGGADAGLIPLSLAMAPRMKASGRYWILPNASHAPIEQNGVILADRRNRAQAEMFCEFLRQPEARAVLERYGFLFR